MRILILGGDGYLGWPTTMHFANQNHEVCTVDNYLRRRMAMEEDSEPLYDVPNLYERAKIFKEITKKSIHVEIGDCADFNFLLNVIRNFNPEVIIHYAEQPSAPYSMSNYKNAKLTLDNNLGTTFSLIWAMIELKLKCHIIKLGTMGEYGTPNIDIEEGWIEIEHKGRKDKFLYPREAGSLYHTTKVLDTDMLWFYVRTYGLKVTDLMQGPVYGIQTHETNLDERLKTIFNYDDIFGTVLNRFVTQAIADVPLTVYGKGGQTRGYLNLIDTIQCVNLAVHNPPKEGEFRVLNQFTEQFSVNQLAEKVKDAAKKININVEVDTIENPRKEMEGHYYNAMNSGLITLGLKPNLLTEDVIVDMLNTVNRYKDKINIDKILPRVKWSS